MGGIGLRKENGRVRWIDIARGICMILVVLGHTMRGGPVWHAVYGFHVAAFFFLAGMTCGGGAILPRLRRDLRRILLPYYCFGLFSIGVFALLGGSAAASYGLSANTDLLDNLKSLLYANGRDRAMLYNTALWFLPCLLVVKALYYILERLCGKLWLILMLSLLLAGLGYGYTCLGLPCLPFSASVALKMLPLFVLGRICYGLPEMSSRRKALVLGLLLLAAACGLSLATPKVNYSDDLFPNILAFCATASMGTAGLCLTSMAIARNGALEYLGRNTLAVMVMHKFPVVLLQMLPPFRGAILQNQTLYGHLLGGIPATALAILLCLLAAQIIKKHAPILLGGRK